MEITSNDTLLGQVYIEIDRVLAPPKPKGLQLRQLEWQARVVARMRTNSSSEQQA